ncbi:cystathionine beta-lyase [Clostridia bacterium]|nr:cystathionine beta-lyase [Clostridia bacterium]
MKYNFDEIIDRKGTWSLKYDCAARRGMPDGLLPMWVADMDFQTPETVRNALKNVAEHGIFGYSEPDESYFEAVRNWFASRHGYETRREWLVRTPGVVFALAAAVEAFTERGGAVLIQPPVYYPFFEVVRTKGRELIENPLVCNGSGYAMDFDDFERKIIENRVKLFLLCSPHNPVGRVWTRGELTTLGEICLRHGVTVVSDEIHEDFVYTGYKHTVFAAISPEFADISVVCTAPSKTFNLAGLQIANIFIKDPEKRRAFRRAVDYTGTSQLGIMGLAACKAAYETPEWADELVAYLEGNLSLIREKFPDVRTQGTYLAWLDFRALGLTDDELDRRVIHGAKLWLDRGTMFGAEGSGFQRVNFACPRAVLADALERLERLERLKI